MPEDRRHDDELAAYTDQLLAGENPEVPPEIEDLAPVVRSLRDVIQPDAKPSPTFRAQLDQQLDREWEQIQLERQDANRLGQRPTRPRARQPVIKRWRQRRMARLVSLAAAVAVILVGALLVIDQESSSQAGSATGPLSWPVVVGVVSVVLVGLLLFWLSQRGKS